MTMRCWTDLAGEIKGLPPEWAAALSSGRAQLVHFFIPRPLTMDETVAVANALVVLLETNQRLQEHSRELATILGQARDNANGLYLKILACEQRANFQADMNDDIEEAP
jgi:hypothetical protein